MAKRKRSLSEGRKLLDRADRELKAEEEKIARAEAQREVHMQTLKEHGISSTKEAEKKLAALEKKHETLSNKADKLLDEVEEKLEEFEDG